MIMTKLIFIENVWVNAKNKIKKKKRRGTHTNHKTKKKKKLCLFFCRKTENILTLTTWLVYHILTEVYSNTVLTNYKMKKKKNKINSTLDWLSKKV